MNWVLHYIVTEQQYKSGTAYVYSGMWILFTSSVCNKEDFHGGSKLQSQQAINHLILQLLWTVANLILGLLDADNGNDGTRSSRYTSVRIRGLFEATRI